MLAVNYASMKNNLDTYYKQVSEEYETLIITGNNEKSVVLITLEEWNKLRKAANNSEYLTKIDKAMNQLNSGNGVVHELIEVDDE